MKSIVGIAAALLLAGLAQAHEGPFDEGKTRAQARQDLEQAYRDGVLPFRRSEYPPTAASKKKNRDAYLRAHPEDAAGPTASDPYSSRQMTAP
ncbi:DUF4148 domain-containing protein [Caballeronia sp. Lep1P3]|uniref:DUF4148 domain-containing protein n=1 Tax=Caballeronia sp. Lep1P3 TaxID=2878150 RepID=UPI00025B9DA5|nr:DUF4148 domain-containing protein [Caballeronia sp. Lep1P3]EKS72762.1 hypothetical protein BURK_004897 [Burkholderia sp. SJ98]